MVDPSFDPSSGHATGISRGLLYSLIKNIPIKELKTYRRRRRRRRLDRDHPFPFSIPFPSIPRFRYRSIDRGDAPFKSRGTNRIRVFLFSVLVSSRSFHQLCPSNE